MNKEERLMMSKEEVRNRAKELLNENQVDLITKYMFLEQQCKKQKEVIDKAIELTKNLLKTEDRGYYQILFKEILKSLGDTEI